MKKGQATYEYILLIAGVLLIAILAFLLFFGVQKPRELEFAKQACFASLAGAVFQRASLRAKAYLMPFE